MEASGWAFLTYVALSARTVAAIDFNDALAESLLANAASLVDVPWSNALNSLDAAFNSGDDSLVYGGLNRTRPLLWSLFKPFHDVADGIATLDGIYLGFENGEWIYYVDSPINKQPGTFAYVQSRNASCVEFNLTFKCLLFYENTTDSVTGRISGLPSVGLSYDPTVRPWYIKSMATKSPAWTDPYAFIGTGATVLGITASRPIVTAAGDYLGVFGADFLLSTMDTFLISTVSTGDEDGRYTLFIADDSGKLISTSVLGASVDASTNTQVIANESSVSVIAAAATAINEEVAALGLRSWTAVSGTVLIFQDETTSEIYYAMSQELKDAYGLRWHVVTVERVKCDYGYYSPASLESQGGQECVECPAGAICKGGTAMPYPKPGYWIDRSDNTADGIVAELRGKVWECPRDTCKGADGSNEGDDDGVDGDLDGSSCWTIDKYNASDCVDDALMCKGGATGPVSARRMLRVPHSVYK